MSYLILNDKTDYESIFYPTHIIGKDNQLIPIYIGAPSTTEADAIGLYVSEWEYNLIRHDKPYFLIHNPDVVSGDIEEINWDEVDDIEDEKSANRDHGHFWIKDEYEGNA